MKAIVQFEDVLKYNEQNLKAHMYLVECYQLLGKDKKASEHLNSVESLNINGDKFIEQFISARKSSLKN